VKVTSPHDHDVTSGHLCIKGRFGWQYVHGPVDDGCPCRSGQFRSALICACCARATTNDLVWVPGNPVVTLRRVDRVQANGGSIVTIQDRPAGNQPSTYGRIERLKGARPWAISSRQTTQPGPQVPTRRPAEDVAPMGWVNGTDGGRPQGMEPARTWAAHAAPRAATLHL